MTARARRPARRSRPLSRRFQWGGALTAALAALALFTLPPGAARADGSTYDPVSGGGTTPSAVTVPWTQGLLDANNTPLTTTNGELSPNSDRSSPTPASPLSFMYDDFKNLSVTVSQTQGITHQGITVHWSGFTASPVDGGTPQAYYLQMMECYGDATSGPTPEQCEYGSSGINSSQTDQGISERTGALCNDPHAVPSTSNPPVDKNGSSATGCDTQEPSDPSHMAPCPGTYCDNTSYNIPFVPVTDPTTPDYGFGDTTYYSEFNTDEVQQTITGADGTGQQQFETLTGVQAPALGCGEQDTSNSNQPRGCWLIIVPRGQYDPNGIKYSTVGPSPYLHSSPLSASNWAQRIQIHLDFAPVVPFCPPGTLERQTVGTQLVARAMQSWQLQLNNAANCSKIYGYSAVPESTSTQQLLSASSGGAAGLAFTTIPIGSEATRGGGTPPANLPPILYAPVAVSALGFGFNINRGSAGAYTAAVKLTPALMVKALTQSYTLDLPEYYPNDADRTNPAVKPPAWAAANPLDISEDPAFTAQALNPAIQPDPQGPINPLLTEEHSALTQQVWNWIQADSTASAWLGGTPDPNGMVVNPAYKSLDLATDSNLDSYPRADDGGTTPGQCAQLGTGPSDDPPPNQTKEMTRCALDLLPYSDNYDSVAAAILAANDPDGGNWDPNARDSQGSFGWWDKAGVEPIGQVFMWGATDTSNLAAYGLIAAQLCKDDGSSCVGPTSASLTAALGSAKPDSSGLLHVDPANPGNGGYPLTDVIYAAVSTQQDPAALNDYADLISFAAGQGQTVGSAAGDLAPGYLPLPSDLQAQAQSVVTQLRALASGSASPTPSASSTTSGGGDAGGASTPLATTSGGATSAPAGGGATSGFPNGTTPANLPTGSSTTAAAPAPEPLAGLTPAPTGTLAAPSSSCSSASLPLPTRTPSSSTPSPARSPSPSPGCSSTAPGAVVSLPSSQAVAGVTPKQVVGAIRWVLIVVMIAGGACAAGGTLLSSGRIPSSLRRRRPGPPGVAPPGPGIEGAP